ncbi:MAG: flagellar biosynthesis protein FlhF [Betaproteobacteria bacterium]|nr:flagellar biosynthesis protein FlhF [Betaproteobacteria bacterium]NDE53448.1 flagellar biosynthesis protein FlhF [Actinomycetota bacterium]
MASSTNSGPRRFVAATATEALSMVKQAIGPDAILLSNREVDNGIEIIAMAQEQFKEIAPRAAARSQAHTAQVSRPTLRSFDDQPTSQGSDRPAAEPLYAPAVTVSAGADRAPRPEALRPKSDTVIRTANHKLVIADVADRPMRNLDGSPVFSPDVAAAHFRSETGASLPRQGGPDLIDPRAAAPDQTRSAGHAAPQTAAKASNPALNELAERLMGQVNEVKHLLESHIAGNTWNQLKGVSPGRAEMLKRLLATGFSPALATSLLEEVGEVEEGASLINTLRQPLASRMRTIDPVTLFDNGGVFAFIGPTGVGKTTTVAKIAARCVMRFGRKAVSLLSTDTYRIGALEQLRVFGKILGLPVTALRDAEDLTTRIQELEKFHVVLIDTAGMGQRDVKMVEQLKVLSEGYKQAQRLLVMSATTSLQTMQDVIQAHSQGKENGIKAAVITKIDEAMSLAPSVDCLIRHDLPLLFIGNGQQVPEDLHVADPGYLAHRSLQPRSYASDFEPADEMVPAMIADNITDWARRK